MIENRRGAELAGLVVLVPEADVVTPQAHIAVLAPFGVDGSPSRGERQEVAELLAAMSPFEFQLTGEATLPGQGRYLMPEPALAFSRITHRLQRAFPEYPPYAGEVDLVVPHLALPAYAVVPDLPLRCYAAAVSLVRYEGGRADGADHLTVLETFSFGSSVA